MMGSLNLKIDNEIAILEFDRPDSKVNVLDAETMSELAAVKGELAEAPQAKALLITSKKENIFIAGADIKEIERIGSAQEARQKAAGGKEILDKLHTLDLITVAVINGACLGGGLELALACKYRVAGFSDRVKIGLPEVNLGVIPGFGGTQRLPRLIGLSRGLGMILSGQPISSQEALKYGLVDRLFPDVRLVEGAKEFVNDLLEKKIKISRKRKKRPLQGFLENTPLGRTILFSQARKNVLKKTRGFYPAPIKALEVIKRTYGRDLESGLLLESEAFGELAVTDTSKNLIKVFYLSEAYKKFPWVDSGVKPLAIRKCAVLGAGLMGGAIAQLLSFNDIPVRLKDVNFDALKKALKAAYMLFGYALKKKKLKGHQVEYKFGLISPTVTYSGFENCDLVIEAVAEDLNLKQTVFRQLNNIAGTKKMIFTSNTSSLPIIKMAEATSSPEMVAGLHFFNPVHRMPLVEVIKSSKTSDETLATCIAFARRLGKVVIVVDDVPGFLINRILLSYLNEAGFLVEEGMKIECLDGIVRKFGMPMGPLELIDEVGIDVGYKVAEILEVSYGPRMQVCPLLEKVKSKGLLGKRSNLGFYVYKGKRKKPNPHIYNLLSRPLRPHIPDDVALKKMIYVMVNEAARCLEERVVDRPHSVDIGMIMGTGFPAFRAGLLRFADSVGIDNIAKDLKAFERESGRQRFRPCAYLLDKAQRKEKFFESSKEENSR